MNWNFDLEEALARCRYLGGPADQQALLTLLREVQDIAAQEARRYEGQTMEVLAEEVNRQQAGMLTGRLSNNFTVHFPADPSLIGKLVQVRLEKCCGFYYVGELA